MERRRRLAASGAVPGRIAAGFTQDEAAVLSVIGREVQGELPRSLGLREPQHGSKRVARGPPVGLVTATERRRRGAKSLTNVVEVISGEWRSRLKLADISCTIGFFAQRSSQSPVVWGWGRFNNVRRASTGRTQIDVVRAERGRQPEYPDLRPREADGRCPASFATPSGKMSLAYLRNRTFFRWREFWPIFHTRSIRPSRHFGIHDVWRGRWRVIS
jgi:hypothetical protein